MELSLIRDTHVGRHMSRLVNPVWTGLERQSFVQPVLKYIIHSQQQISHNLVRWGIDAYTHIYIRVDGTCVLSLFRDNFGPC